VIVLVHVVPGSHLFRDTEVNINNLLNESGEIPASGPAADAALQAGWLHGRRHPLTHAPMGTLKVELPPGR
jgi:hypothetical protein